MLEFSCVQGELTRELSLVSVTVPKRGPSSAVGNILVTANDESVTLRAIDNGNTSYTGVVPARVSKPGEIVLTAAMLMSWVSTFPAEERINVKETANNWLTLSAGRNRSRIAGRNPSDFPTLPPLSPSLATVPSDVLRDAVKHVAFARPEMYDASNITRNGVNIEVTHNGVTAVATNGNRLAVKTHTFEVENLDEPFSFVVDGDSVDTLVKLLPEVSVPVEMLISDQHVRFCWDGSEFFFRRISGRFVNYAPVVAVDRPNSVLVPASSLRKAVSRVNQFSDDTNKVTFSFQRDGLCLLASTSHAGEGEETVEINYDGDPVEIGLSATQLEPFLKLAGDNPLEIRFRGGNVSVMMSIHEDASWHYLLAPMFTPENGTSSQ